MAARAGAKATFGTNPLMFACPVAGAEPFIFDMATAAVALFGVLTCQATGTPLPEHSAYDAAGEWTTSVSDIPVGGGGGAIAAFGGHKGVGLALMIELLCAALSGGAVLGQDEPKKTAKNWGHHVIVIDPEAHVDGFAARAASIIQTVASSHADGGEARAVRRSTARRRTGVHSAGTPHARSWLRSVARSRAGHTPTLRAAYAPRAHPAGLPPRAVRIPGRSSDAIAAANKEKGSLPVPKRIWDVICATAKSGL